MSAPSFLFVKGRCPRFYESFNLESSSPDGDSLEETDLDDEDGGEEDD